MVLYDIKAHVVLEPGEFRVQKRFKCQHMACASLGSCWRQDLVSVSERRAY